MCWNYKSNNGWEVWRTLERYCWRWISGFTFKTNKHQFCSNLCIVISGKFRKINSQNFRKQFFCLQSTVFCLQADCTDLLNFVKRFVVPTIFYILFTGWLYRSTVFCLQVDCIYDLLYFVYRLIVPTIYCILFTGWLYLRSTIFCLQVDCTDLLYFVYRLIVPTI